MRLRNRSQAPSSIEEKTLKSQGYRHIAGIDEVGRGALAGPVVAAAIILPFRINTPWLKQIKDSKQLSPTKREFLYHHLYRTAISIGIGIVSQELIDDQGIIRATRLAMKRAIEQLSPPAESLLIDHLLLPEVPLPQKGITGGDSRCLSIACASIVAKVTRDHLMIDLDKAYPDYGLAKHKGYGTKKHFACLYRLGPSPIHRRSFHPAKDIIMRRHKESKLLKMRFGDDRTY
jgi:ribonuclease HII